MIKENQAVALHERAKSIVKEIIQNEAELVLSLQEIVTHKVYRRYKYPSLFSYLTLSLGLSESRAYDFSVVVRASLRFERLNQAVCSGKISVSKARRITPVLTEENQEAWLKKAHLSTHRQLEKLVAGQNPESVQTESYKYVSENQIEVRVTMTRDEFNQFKRAQDILCQKMKKQVSLKATLACTANEYIKRNDPLFKAAKAIRKITQNQKRNENQHEKTEPVLKLGAKPGTCRKRRPLPAAVRHQVNIRDEGTCRATMPDGKICGESKWIDFHHIIPVHQGGEDTIENLIVLCRGHHQIQHDMQQTPT